MRAALYARFSSDLQNAASIGDQLHACRRHAEQLGANVADDLVFSDAAISGASVNRPGLRDLMAAAAEGRIDVVVCEALDRLTRSGGGAWDIFEDLAACGVAIHTISEGKVEEMHVMLKGGMNALFLKELARKTRRGQEGVARDGRHTGGRTYGYRIRRELDARGDVVRGLREIDAAEASIVREIFTRYAAGESPRAIVSDLNARQVPGPSGGLWNASTVNGNARRGNGILHNELYRGVLVWGRHAWVKDRRTGKRRARAGEAAAIVRQDAEELRIVDEDLWARAQARYVEVQKAGEGLGRKVAQARPKGLLSGLMRCGSCGGPMTLAGPDRRFLCTVRREKGQAICANGRGAKASDVEARVLEAVRRDLLHPVVIETAMREYQAAKAAKKKAAHGQRTALLKELEEIERRQARLIGQVEEGAPWAAVAARHGELEARRVTLADQLAAAEKDDPGRVVEAIPSAPGAWRLLVEQLQARLDDEPTAPRHEARELLRKVIRSVDVHPLEGRGQYRLAVQTDLAPILTNEKAAPVREPLLGLEWVRGRAANLILSLPFTLAA